MHRHTSAASEANVAGAPALVGHVVALAEHVSWKTLALLDALLGREQGVSQACGRTPLEAQVELTQPRSFGPA